MDPYGTQVSSSSYVTSSIIGLVVAIFLIIVSNTFYSWGESLTAAFLPELARPQALGKVLIRVLPAWA